MTESVYNVIELVGTSKISWEDAAKSAIERASKTLRDLRIAEVKEMDAHIDNGKIIAFRTKIRVSFRVEVGDELEYRKDPHSWLHEKEHLSLDG
jgi:flavin-binding protein dodecin